MPLLSDSSFFRGTAIGFCMSKQIEAVDGTQVLGILRLAVLPDQQKQGVGTRLIEACLARAWSLNLKAVEIVLPSCECGKGKASDFLASFGFKAGREIIEHYETTYGRDLDGYVFRLTLKGQL
jgi:N-acetylglutamate synthase-like GNAT family acetyltransferase